MNFFASSAVTDPLLLEPPPAQPERETIKSNASARIIGFVKTSSMKTKL